MDMIKFEDLKAEMRVGTIVKAEPHPNADKLMVLQVNLGAETRQIVAGIKKHYEANQLVGTQIVVIVNLEPRKLRGIESQGMLLAVSNEVGDLVLIRPDHHI